MMKTRRNQLICSFTGGFAVALVVSTWAQNPFVQVTDTGALGEDPADWGLSWGDYDGDGDVDAFDTASYWPPRGGRRRNWVHENDGSGMFTRAEDALLGDLATDDGDATMGVWGDIDNDGDLDLYVANYLEDGIDLSTPPAGDYLYVNNGAGFTRHTTAPFTTYPYRSECASLLDYDRDGLLDVFIAAHGSQPLLYHGDGSLEFTPVFSLAAPLNARFGAWGDFDGDGDLDLVTGDVDGNRSSYLFVNESTSEARDAFTVLTAFPDGTALPTHASCADWGDVDNDGDLDLLMPEVFVTGCNLFLNEGEGHFEEMVIPMQDGMKSASVCWVDVDNDSDLDLLVGGRSVEEPERISYFENEGALSFREHVINVPGKFNSGAALADWDNDGFMDFYVNAFQVSDYAAHNTPNDNHWLKLVLKGTVSNASAVGAVVRIKASIDGMPIWQMRHVRAGSEMVFVQHDPRPNFGLGDATVAEVVRIEWPSGIVQELTNVPADQILTVAEPVRLSLDGPNQLSWYSSKAREYTLESAASVNGPWFPATEAVEAAGNLRTATIQTDAGTRFYRLVQP